MRVLVMAPHLGRDLRYVDEVDPSVEVLDGNRALEAELVDLGQLPGPVPEDAPSRDERDHLLGEAEVLLLGFPVPSLLVDRAPSLQWVHHTQAGVSNLRRSDLWTSAVPLTSSRGAVGVTGIAEYVLAAVYYFARGLSDAVRQKSEGVSERTGYRMGTVAGSTMGIVGLGGIGREAARLAKGAGMRVVGIRRSDPGEALPDGVDELLPRSELTVLAAHSDYLVVAAQLTSETEKMIDGGVFSSMKRGGVLINVARGEIIDEEAMLEALDAGQLRGAVLDVYDGETLGAPPRPYVLEHPRIIFTPHVAPVGDRSTVEKVRALFATNLGRYLRGQPLVNLVDRARGY
jgi:phosphoglycerate dehydrogenase-like enzyme